MKNLIYPFLLLICLSSCRKEQQKLPEIFLDANPPEYLGEPVASAGTSLLKDREGKLFFIYRKGDWDHGGFTDTVFYKSSEDEGRSWSVSHNLVVTPGKPAQSFAAISPISGEVILFYKDVGVGMMSARSKNGWKEWEFQQMHTQDSISINTIGYGNALWVNHSDSKRILCGFHGNNNEGAGTFYSDDDGRTWQVSNRVNVKNEVPNIWQTGAVEPTFAELSNGDILMFIRNSNYHVWQSISKDKGASWSKAEETNLYCGDNSWGSLKNLSDGSILYIWNNAKSLSPESTLDKWNFTGREVLHVAISDDDGKTWAGFRELMLDRLRDSLFVNHPGDKGLNESKPVETKHGNILIATGQAEAHRAFVLLDPNWIRMKERSDNFSDGTVAWSRQKIMIRPAVYDRWYHHNYDRKPGAVLVPHPDIENKKVLHVRRPADTTVFSQRDGAVWNFPAGKKGVFETRIRLNENFKGSYIALNDRWFQPIDNQGLKTAMFVFNIPANGVLSENLQLTKEKWYDIRLEWDGADNKMKNSCTVYVDNMALDIKLALKNVSHYGISYVRFRSATRWTDNDGMYIESVMAKVE